MEVMYKSTRSDQTVTASQAILKGLASDGGLFVPVTLPKLNVSIEELKENALQDKPEADEMVRSVEAAVNDFNYEEAEQLLRAFLKKFEEE